MPKIIFLLILLITSGCRSKSDWSEIFIQKGETYLRKGAYEQGLNEFSKAQSLAPANERIYEKRAQIYLKMGKHNEALESLNKVIQLNPNCKASIYFMRAEIVAADPIHTREAIRTGYDPAIQRDPHQGIYFYKRGLAYQILEEEENALADFQAASQLGFETNDV